MYSKIPIAKRYSSALFELSDEKNVSDQVLSDLISCNENITNDKNISKIIFNHYTPTKLQIKMVQYLDQKNRFNELTSDFLNILARNNRCCILREVTEIYKNLVIESKNEVVVKLQSPYPIGKNALMKLKSKLEGSIKKSIVINLNINKNLSAGVIITFQNKMLDYSLDSKYKNILNLCKPI